MKRTLKALLGGVLVLVGLVMLVTPGPALVVIPLGLAILATEFPWVKEWMARARRWLRSKIQPVLAKLRRAKERRPRDVVPANETHHRYQ